MTGPQRNVKSSQLQFTSALCWSTEEESGDKKEIQKSTFFILWTTMRLEGRASVLSRILQTTFLFDQHILDTY